MSYLRRVQHIARSWSCSLAILQGLGTNGMARKVVDDVDENVLHDVLEPTLRLSGL